MAKTSSIEDAPKEERDCQSRSAVSNLPSIKRQSDFQHLKDQGQFVHITHWLAVSYKKNSQNTLRWAWTLSKKTGNAVTRNRLKRWSREFVREYSEKEIDINFIFKQKRDRDFYRKISREEFLMAFEKVFKKAQ